MRADRLVAATLYLQRHGRVTAARLADHLDVSVATARRDLKALSTAGVPVYPSPGRGGGWQLVGGARTDLTGLTEPEVIALFAAVTPTADSTAGTAFAKLVRALPAPFRDLAEAASSSVRVDASSWDERPDRSPLHAAIVRRRRARIRYRARGSTSVRTIALDPWRVVSTGSAEYLLAGTARGPRTYRLDRVDAVEILDHPSVPADPAEVDAFWEQTRRTVASARTAVRARIRAEPEVIALLTAQLGAAAVTAIGECEAIVASHIHRSIAEQLAGWGSAVLVLEPESVRTELLAIADEITATYRAER